MAGLAAVILATFVGPRAGGQAIVGSLSQHDLLDLGLKASLATAMVAAFLVRGRALVFCTAIAIVSMTAHASAERSATTHTWRSFFGVLTESETRSNVLGSIRMLAHGTTLHGAQARDPRLACQPLVYYAPTTPIGQVFLGVQHDKPAVHIGAVGLGTGSVAALRSSHRSPHLLRDRPAGGAHLHRSGALQLHDPLRKGPIDYVIGDARLTVAKQPAGIFDILLIDAFSSDAVPVHLLTVEAVRAYLTHLKPDGVLILHLSNRNLELNKPAQAVAAAAGRRGACPEISPQQVGERGVRLGGRTPSSSPVPTPAWTASRPTPVGEKDRPEPRAPLDGRLHEPGRRALAAGGGETAGRRQIARPQFRRAGGIRSHSRSRWSCERRGAASSGRDGRSGWGTPPAAG